MNDNKRLKSDIFILFDKGKTKCILFVLQQKLKNDGVLNIMYNGIEIKQYSKVTYFRCLLDETMPGESMALKTFRKINLKFNFLFRKNRFLTLELLRLLFSAIIQPHFDYTFSVYYLNGVFEFVPGGNINLRNDFLKRRQPFQNRSSFGIKSRKH